MKRVYIITVVTCLVILGVFLCLFSLMNINGGRDHLTVGFIYDNDESAPYTYNFSLAKDALVKKYGDRVTVMACSNAMDDDIAEPISELAEAGCDIMFFNGYSDLVVQLAPEYPDIQFCQTSYTDMSNKTVPDNYHTFKGEGYQGRYVAGIAAGMKIKEMISEGIITEDQAVVGYLAAFPSSEVISGYTAFLMGVRSIVPTAVMQVKYTYTWSSYYLEKDYTLDLIENGCVIISQHTDTIGPAVACEEASQNTPVYFVGYNQSMSDVAPTTSLVTFRLNWEPYVLAATDAVFRNKEIESNLSGHIHGHDVSAGFENGWVIVEDLNAHVAAPDTEKAMNNAIDMFMRGYNDFVYKGNLIGVNPKNSGDTYDLSAGYIENEFTSYPTFNYILTDIVTIVQD